jgi:hypothetical protein
MEKYFLTKVIKKIMPKIKRVRDSTNKRKSWISQNDINKILFLILDFNQMANNKK